MLSPATNDLAEVDQRNRAKQATIAALEWLSSGRAGTITLGDGQEIAMTADPEGVLRETIDGSAANLLDRCKYSSKHVIRTAWDNDFTSG